MWENFVEPSRPQMTMWHTCITCWIPEATDKHTDCVILIGFPLQQYLHEGASMLRYTYFACFLESTYLVFFCLRTPASVSWYASMFGHTAKQFNYRLCDVLLKYITVKPNFTLCVHTYICIYVLYIYTHISSLMKVYKCLNILAYWYTL